jgi:ATP-dependent RNA helicase DDX42
VAAIHGDKTQNERTKIMHAFKSGSLSVLVATDVAARGLDIKSIKTVVNYFMPRDIDSYVHRIGRTGRAGDKTGVAYALITRKETFFAGELVKVLEGANQRVPPDLMNIAMQVRSITHLHRNFALTFHFHRTTSSESSALASTVSSDSKHMTQFWTYY